MCLFVDRKRVCFLVISDDFLIQNGFFSPAEYYLADTCKTKFESHVENPWEIVTPRAACAARGEVASEAKPRDALIVLGITA